MPRDIPIGNSRLMLAFDQYYNLRDLYFPHVGQENHIGGDLSRFGVSVDGRFAWVGPDWKIDRQYEEDTLVTRVSLYHPDLKILLHCRDAVDFHENIYLKEITVENLLPEERLIKLFLHLDFNISGNDVGDTAAFDPETGGIVHYKGARYFLANGMVAGAGGLSEYAVGQKGVLGKEGTFRDAEDGILSGNPIAQGSVDSVLGLTLAVAGLGSGQAAFWLSAGQTWKEARRLDNLVKYKLPRRPDQAHGGLLAVVGAERDPAAATGARRIWLPYIGAACLFCARKSTGRGASWQPPIPTSFSSTVTPMPISGPGTAPWRPMPWI